MYGVVEIAGHQYKVQKGDIIDVQKLEAKEGEKVTFDKVLFIGGDTVKVGAPTVSGASVTAEVVRHDRSRKIIVFKRKRRGGRRVKNGHRQHFTCLKITDVKA